MPTVEATVKLPETTFLEQTKHYYTGRLLYLDSKISNVPYGEGFAAAGSERRDCLFVSHFLISFLSLTFIVLF